MEEKRVALIIGGSTGIGRGMADVLLALGYNVIVVSRERRKLTENVIHHKCDILDTTQRLSTIKMLREKYDKLHLVVMAVGGIRKDEGKEFELNCTAPVGFVRELLEICEMIDTIHTISSLAKCFWWDKTRFRPRGYAFAKMKLEEEIVELAKNFPNTAFVISRPGYVFTRMLNGLRRTFYPEGVEKVARKLVTLTEQKAKRGKVVVIYPTIFPWLLSRFEKYPRWFIIATDRTILHSYRFYKRYLR